MASLGFFDPWWAEPAGGGLDRLRREMEEVFDRFGGDPYGTRGTPYPPVNLYETSEGYVLTAEVPGVRPEEVEVSIEDDRVTLRGERTIAYADDPQTSLHRRERQSGVFRRTVRLPVPADPDKAQAAYRDGVLMLRLPKAPAHQPRRIQVQSA